MNKTLTAQDVAELSQDDFDQLDDGLIHSLLTGEGRSAEGGKTPPEERQEAAKLDPVDDRAHDPASNPNPKTEEDDPEAITIDEDGRARNARGKFVPHKALHAEREEHKKTRSERDNLKLENAKYSERLNMLLQALEPEPKPQTTAAAHEQEIQPVNPEEDLIGALKQIQELTIRGRGKPSQDVQELRQTVEQMQQHNQVVHLSNRYASDIQNAKANVEAMPNFDDAVRHLVLQQDAMLAAQGWTDPSARRAEIQAAERNFVLKAYREGANPAERLYAMAKAVGWQPKANGNGTANGSNGQQSPVEQKIDNIARMQKASPSLSNVSGAGGDSLPSAAQIAAMSEEDFDAFVNRVGGIKAFEKRYMGRER